MLPGHSSTHQEGIKCGVTRTITYRNLGPATELVLELDMLGPEGLRPPTEMFTVPRRAALPER